MADTRQIVKWRLELPGLTDDISGLFNFHAYFDTTAEFADRLERLGLTEVFAKAFLITNPIYYGWFIGPKLTQEQCSLLKILIVDLNSNERKTDHDIQRFVAALDVAISGYGLLQVALTPPGHTDFGYYTIFCHCPRCKADAGLKRWTGNYPSEPMQCNVCGFEYSPAATVDHRKMYSFQEIQCLSCLKIIKRTDFDVENQDHIEDYLRVRQFEAERRMVKLVSDFERRYPGVKPTKYSIKCEEEGEKLPDDQKIPLSIDDKRAIIYRRSHKFNTDARAQFLEEAIDAARTKEIPLVTCPLCNGALF